MTEPHGPALIKVGACMEDVAEFYGVFVQGRLLPNRFRSYAEAATHFRNFVEATTT